MTEQEHDDALAEAEPEERLFVAAALDHVRDRHDGRRRPRAEARRSNAGREPSTIREPLERVADAGAVHRARAHAANGCREIQHRQRRGIGVHHPRDRAQEAAYDDHRTRSVLVDEIAFNRHEPGFGHHENRERDLNGRASPVVLFIDGVHKQRPAVLHVRDHGHADHAEYELYPRRSQPRRSCLTFRFHCLSPWRIALSFGMPSGTLRLAQFS
jgi:hypothetical protein